MNAQLITLTDLKQNLGDIVNQAAYGQSRIVLTARGKPRAALISIEDLRQLQMLEQGSYVSLNIQEQLALLAEMDELRVKMGTTTDSTETLRQIREERLDGILGVS